MPAASADLFLGALGATYVARDEAAPGDAAPEGAALAGAGPGERPAVGPALAASIDAVAARLIPGDAHWPSAGTVGAGGHVVAILAAAPQLAPPVHAMLEAAGADLAEAAPDRQDARLRAVEADPDHAAAFRALYEWVCEAYYRHPAVEAVTLARTGFDPRLPRSGTPMAPFDESRLDRVRALPPRYREVPR